MNQRYWLRHHLLSGHVGPLLSADLEAAVRGGSLPAAGEALLDEGQDKAARDRAVWTAVTVLFGMQPAAETAPAALADESMSPERALLLQRRRDTAYAPLRLSIEVATALAIFYQLVVLIPWPSNWGLLRFEVVCEFVFSIVAALVVRGVLHLVVDLADGRLTKDRRSSGDHS